MSTRGTEFVNKTIKLWNDDDALEFVEVPVRWQDEQRMCFAKRSKLSVEFEDWSSWRSTEGALISKRSW